MSDVTYFTAAGQPSFATETRISKWTRQFAFGNLEPTAIIFTATHQQLDNAYSRPSNLSNYNLNGVTAYFCDDIGFRDIGGNVCEWTREIATMPANYSEPETYAYSYPGFMPFGPNVNIRAPFTREVTSKVLHEFFLVGNTTLGANYNTSLEIPSTTAQNYAWPYILTGSAVAQFVEGYLSNLNANSGLFGSTPTYGTYIGWAATDNTTASSYSIEATDSILEQYRGPIWKRTRRFVKAR